MRAEYENGSKTLRISSANFRALLGYARVVFKALRLDDFQLHLGTFQVALFKQLCGLRANLLQQCASVHSGLLTEAQGVWVAAADVQNRLL